MKKAIQIDIKDNVATVTSEVAEGETVEVLSPEGELVGSPKVLSEIIFGHKIALKSFDEGDEIIKYGEVMGGASMPIKLGEWIHTHNVESVRVPTSKWGEYGP
ncbi:MAG: UxaA family hydrolase [Candidatus Bathyarchaeota archaeon]|jgi:altronate dehydratase small subunit